jgi:hypothetical protein
MSRSESGCELRLTILMELAAHRVESNDKVTGASGLTVPWTVLDIADGLRGVRPARLDLDSATFNSDQRQGRLHSAIVGYGKITRP